MSREADGVKSGIPLGVQGFEYARWNRLAAPENRGVQAWRLLAFVCGASIWIYMVAFGYKATMLARPLTASWILGAGLLLPIYGGIVAVLVAAHLHKSRLGEGVPIPPEAPTRAMPAKIKVGAFGASAGTDVGWIWAEKGKLVFKGSGTAFHIGPEDFRSAKGLEATMDPQRSGYLKGPNLVRQFLNVTLKATPGRSRRVATREMIQEVRAFAGKPENSLLPPIECGYEHVSLRPAIVAALPSVFAVVPLWLLLSGIVRLFGASMAVPWSTFQIAGMALVLAAAVVGPAVAGPIEASLHERRNKRMLAKLKVGEL